MVRAPFKGRGRETHLGGATHDLRNAPLAVRGSVFGEINPSRGIFTGNQVSVFFSLRSPTLYYIIEI